jgi:hypothetical protein
LASHPNYLGTPEVVSALVCDIINDAIKRHARAVAPSDYYAVQKRVLAAFTTDDTYPKIPGWHTERGLGKAIVEFFNMDPVWFAGDSYAGLVDEGIAAVAVHVHEMLTAFAKSTTAQSKTEFRRQLGDASRAAADCSLGKTAKIRCQNQKQDDTGVSRSVWDEGESG